MYKDDLGNVAKNKLTAFARIMEDRLESFWNEEIKNNFGFNTDQKKLVERMLLHAKDHNQRSGKRLRASFVYYGYLLNNNIGNDEVLKAAEAIELVHTALLMHDDFMDQDILRRGLPTTQVEFADGDSHYGDSMAVNIGDVVLCLGYERLMKVNLKEGNLVAAMTQLLRGIAITAFGQAYDVSLPKIGKITEDEVLCLHKAKSAVYTYENPLFVGALLGGLDRKYLEVLHRYAMLGGVAFQLQDDILGVYGDEEKTGKSANSDILQGKITLLIAKAFELGNEEQKQIINKVWGNKKATKNELAEIKKVIKDTGSYDYSVKVAKKMAEKARVTAKELDGNGLNIEAIEYLEGIAQYMVEREV